MTFIPMQKELVAWKRAAAKTQTYKAEDYIIPDLGLPSPCPISVEITKSAVLLQIGQRDFTWDRSTGELTDTGTFLGNYEETEAIA